MGHSTHRIQYNPIAVKAPRQSKQLNGHPFRWVLRALGYPYAASLLSQQVDVKLAATGVKSHRSVALSPCDIASVPGLMDGIFSLDTCNELLDKARSPVRALEIL